MGVNWNGILGGSRPLGGDNISRHAAIHHSIDGFKFRNPPEGDLPKRYRWMARTGVLTVEPTDAVRYLRLKVEAVCDGATPQVVTVVAGTFTDRYWVLGERSLTIPVSPGVTDIQLAVDKLVPPRYARIRTNFRREGADLPAWGKTVPESSSISPCTCSC